MTFSILMHDPETGSFAAGAATGSLCVGGWVLRGDIEAGLVASQGTAPSTFWRDDALRQMYGGETASFAVQTVTQPDAGRSHRQMIALDTKGGTAGFTGTHSVPFAGHMVQNDLAVAGNMLTGNDVLCAMLDAAAQSGVAFDRRILAVLQAAARAGGDMRGLQSAALLVLRPDQPPMDLRVDFDPDPIAALGRLSDRARRSPYHDWLQEVPVLEGKTRAPEG